MAEGHLTSAPIPATAQAPTIYAMHNMEYPGKNADIYFVQYANTDVGCNAAKKNDSWIN
jgi:hypothetical protein